MTATPIYLGTDFGGTKIRAGVVRAVDGAVLGSAEVPTEAEGGVACVLAQLDLAFRAACDAAGAALADIAAIGVAAPGEIDRATGGMIHGPNLGWRDVPLGALLAERYAVPIAIENDVNAACLGETRFGAARGARDAVAIFVGTGIGGGILANGELVGGATGAAGEVGHLIWREDGDPCSCGKRGHFESYAGGSPVERNFRRRVRAGLETRALELAGGDPERIHLGVIFDAADAGDAACAAVVRDLERALAALAANVASLLNPALIVLGGGVVRRRRALVEVAATGVRELATEAAARSCRVVASQLWEDAAVLGSVEAVVRRAAA